MNRSHVHDCGISLQAYNVTEERSKKYCRIVFDLEAFYYFGRQLLYDNEMFILLIKKCQRLTALPALVSFT